MEPKNVTYSITKMMHAPLCSRVCLHSLAFLSLREQLKELLIADIFSWWQMSPLWFNIKFFYLLFNWCVCIFKNTVHRKSSFCAMTWVYFPPSFTQPFWQFVNLLQEQWGRSYWAWELWCLYIFLCMLCVQSVDFLGDIHSLLCRSLEHCF